ncbi:amidohydrolase [Olivibacter sp. XZL3]|uniref:amidohydrolase n=1 Tax=Olivibacter sp. XZL3 TaxID=1735116 RepID=UPI0010651498|nr:amidohydrolase [Olivibacter sp. XZL3]
MKSLKRRERWTKRLALLLLGFSNLVASAQTADQVFYGKIYTQNDQVPWAEAMAVSSDTIMAVGSVSEVQRLIGKKTVVVQLTDKQLLLPGFIDSHTHLVDGGFRLFSVQLREAKTPQAFIDTLKAYVKTLKPGEWITGGNWDHQNWNGEMPTRHWIDSITPHNPVAITRMDGHTILVNSLAMKLAGVDNRQPDVAGGEIIRKDGELLGLFKDNAKNLITAKIPPATREQKEKALQGAMHYMAQNGVTSVVSLTGTGFGSYYDVYEKARLENKLNTRIYAAKEIENWQALGEEVKAQGNGDRWLRRGALKGFMDGSLGAHTAAFKEAFSDTPRDSGFLVVDEQTMYARMKGADSLGLHLIVHAIGDRSVTSFLNMVARLERENGPRDRRIRMEHAQHVSAEDFKRFKELGVIASMQPYHAIDDGRWADKVIGSERAKHAFAMKSMFDEGTKVVFGSDWHVAPASPMLGIYAAVTRRTIDGANPDGWVPEQKITVEQAVRAYTIDAAYGIFEEGTRGSLIKGKLADFVILNENILNIDPNDLPNVTVLNTYVGGKEVYRKP